MYVFLYVRSLKGATVCLLMENGPDNNVIEGGRELKVVNGACEVSDKDNDGQARAA